MELAHDVFVVPVTRAMIERLLGKLHENEDILICAPFSRGDSVNPVTILECLATIGATPQELVRPGATMRRVGSLELDLIERTARGERPIGTTGLFPFTNLVDVHMGRLRRKVDMPNEVPMIENIRGGFILRALA